MWWSAALVETSGQCRVVGVCCGCSDEPVHFLPVPGWGEAEALHGLFFEGAGVLEGLAGEGEHLLFGGGEHPVMLRGG